ncbi:hypothetical protein ACJX0J_015498, partial [Zea mays]
MPDFYLIIFLFLVDAGYAVMIPGKFSVYGLCLDFYLMINTASFCLVHMICLNSFCLIQIIFLFLPSSYLYCAVSDTVEVSYLYIDVAVYNLCIDVVIYQFWNLCNRVSGDNFITSDYMFRYKHVQYKTLPQSFVV